LAKEADPKFVSVPAYFLMLGIDPKRGAFATLASAVPNQCQPRIMTYPGVAWLQMVSSNVRIPMEAQRVMACAHHVARIDGELVGNPVDVEVYT
jgi:hypothetical protein